MAENRGKMMTLNFLNSKSVNADVSRALKEASHESALAEDVAIAAQALDAGTFKLSNHEINFINHNPESIAKYLVFRYKFRFYPVQRKLNDYPLHVLVEPTSICNLRCVMCFQSDESFRGKPYAGNMSFELFKKIVDESQSNGLNALTLSGRGEPLLNKRIADMLRYAGGKFFDFKLNTNATVMNESMCRAILDSGLTELVFSVDSTDKETYAKIRVGGDLDDVIRNIERFNSIRAAEYKSSRINTRVSAVLVNEGQDLEAFHAFWKNYADDVSCTKAIDRNDTYNNTPTNLDHPCERLWHRLYIWWDGTASPCDYDYKSHLDMGNAATSSIKDVWLGKKMEDARNLHSQGKRCGMDPCVRCSL